MAVALKQSITAWVTITVASQCITGLAKGYWSWLLSLAWGFRRALCAAPGQEDIAGQGGSTALPAASAKLFEIQGGCRNPHPQELLLAVVQGMEMPFPGRGGCQSLISGAEGT